MARTFSALSHLLHWLCRYRRLVRTGGNWFAFIETELAGLSQSSNAEEELLEFCRILLVQQDCELTKQKMLLGFDVNKEDFHRGYLNAVHLAIIHDLPTPLLCTLFDHGANIHHVSC